MVRDSTHFNTSSILCNKCILQFLFLAFLMLELFSLTIRYKMINNNVLYIITLLVEDKISTLHFVLISSHYHQSIHLKRKFHTLRMTLYYKNTYNEEE